MSSLGHRDGLARNYPPPRPSPRPHNTVFDNDTDILPASPHILTRQPSQDIGDRQDEQLPILTHRLRHTSSILAIVLSDEYIYAGTQAGEILVYGLRTFERKAVIEGHRGSVLGLCLNADHSLLFSSAGDRIVNVWRTRDYTRHSCLYSSYDVGDIFCVAHSSVLQTVYMGAQNTSIQWCREDKKGTHAAPTKPAVVAIRDDDFFESRSVTGLRTPRPLDAEDVPRHATGGETIEIDRQNIIHFAHYGYVYCMLLASSLPGSASNQEVLVTGGGDGVVKVWALDPETGAPSELFDLEDGREEGHSILSISLNDSFLYSGRSGGEVDVWDLETRQLIRNLKAHRDDVQTVLVGGGFMFSAAITGYVRKFDRQYNLKSRLKAHDGRVLTSAFTYHRRRPIYVTGGNDNTLAVWDVSDCVTIPMTVSRTSNEQLVDSLGKFISFRTVSSDPHCAVDCRRGASYLRSVFKNFGAATEMLSTQADPNHSYNPIILAKFMGNPAHNGKGKRKKILFYGHYDVVPAENWNGKWIVDPFQMEGIDGYLYGRGTSDNKGPIMAAIFACAELRSEQALGSDVIFLIEGEEESGSRGFEQAIRANKDKIGDVDWILLANSYWLDDRIPCLTYGLRGVIHAKVQIDSARPDMHSGVDGSAQLDESLKDLVMLLSKLTGKHGDVKIPGFYDPILPLTQQEKQLYTDITTALVQRNPDLGDPEALAKSLMRRWREASLTLHHFHTSGPENATIIPRSARAALSMRLVPNQEADKVATALVEHLQSEFLKLDSNNTLTITIDHQAEPWLGDWTNELFQTLERAVMSVWGPIDQSHRRRSSIAPPHITVPPSKDATGYFAAKKSPTTSSDLANGSAVSPSPLSPMSQVNAKLEDFTHTQTSKKGTGSPTKRRSTGKRGASVTEIPPAPPPAPKPLQKPLYIREGGSIPAIRFLEKEFGAPAAHLPCGQASDSAHLDNERLRLVNLYKSREVFKEVFREVVGR
ncbi:hypothetical protein BDY17DRAFT_293926 [Neohortaea acidophila]|uniref:Peptidase M20 dimerisation domain-containing protein n=1 Tax=Neohortaea acidophila TaxID=245834 RepID=A0A6A6Q1N3_9PEZI|nr:uncharacterized protein BDY17DRAFT_293926 [Neohortaea acidophila]KAF2485583.1 hypothetical protein BDY17DRAFT_293926 [Neohortaea acidophila]